MKFTHLPHKNLPNQYQFITFRTHDSIDAYIKKLQLSNQENSKKQYYIDEYADYSTNGAYLHNEVLSFLHAFLLELDKTHYELISFAIMPNHVHLLTKPLIDLPLLIQKIKGASAKQINNIMGRKGKFWASEYYDKGIRNQKHFNVVYEYIKNNPLKLPQAYQSPLRFYGIWEVGR